MRWHETNGQIQADEINYNKIAQRGTTTNNLIQFYPNSILIEYHFPENEDKSWVSLWLIFQEENGVWSLVGIAHDEWTI